VVSFPRRAILKKKESHDNFIRLNAQFQVFMAEFLLQWIDLLDHELKTLKMETSKPPKHWFPTTKLQDETTQKK
jgi:hypothetical protein